MLAPLNCNLDTLKDNTITSLSLFPSVMEINRHPESCIYFFTDLKKKKKKKKKHLWELGNAMLVLSNRVVL